MKKLCNTIFLRDDIMEKKYGAIIQFYDRMAEMCHIIFCGMIQWKKSVVQLSNFMTEWKKSAIQFPIG